MTAIDTSNNLSSFNGLNRTNPGDESNFEATREITKRSVGGFFEHWKQKSAEFQDQLPPPSSMKDVLDALKDDLSQESLDAYFAKNGDKLQQIGAELGLEGEVTGMTLNQGGSFTVTTASGESANFSMLNVRV